MKEQLQPLEQPQVDLFVDREEQLDKYWDWATSIPGRHANSHALIGRRRIGKTAILSKLFNRLFYEQKAVTPVFISFAEFLHREEPITSYEFARHYFSGYVRCYLAFHYQEPMLIREERKLKHLHDFAEQMNDKYILEMCGIYDDLVDEPIPFDLVQWVINFPKGTAATRDIPTAIIVDEFQILTRVYDPIQKVHRDLTNSFQRAVETRWAPLLVSGSAVSLLVSDALGGMLQGRFGYHHLKPLPRKYAHSLVFKLGDYWQVDVTDELAELVYKLTDGIPHSIHCLMTSDCPSRDDLPDLDAMHEILRYELSDLNGRILQHHSREFAKYSDELNHGTTTRRVMLWVTKFPDERVDAEMASSALGIDWETARDALEKLRWADVVNKVGMISYHGPSDPMMRRYIEYQHSIEIDKVGPEKPFKDWEQEYNSMLGQLNSTKGELGAMYVRMVMSRFTGQEVDGAAYFNCDGRIALPNFVTIERRGGVVTDGIPAEIDVVGEWSQGVWMVEVKYTQERIGAKLVQDFIDRCEKFRAKTAYDHYIRWYFSKSGFTKEALALLKQAGILYNDWEQFRTLARSCGCLGLPIKPT